MKRIGNLYFHGGRNKRQIALTFDDGPSEETEKILDLLKKYNAKATFFVWGERIKGREKIIERMIKEEHEIGNHSYEHKRLAFKSKDYIEKDLKKLDEKLSQFNIKTNLFRPPKLSMFYNLFRVCKKLEKKIIICDVISHDWKKPGIEKIVNKILRKTKNGSIINFHDYIEGVGSNKDIPAIIEQIFPKLKDNYRFVTVSELLDFNSS
ncbi:polysaccharide deacetylase family protein [Candidatus Pacearchaeota archaeon]|nr:polysaccharide deacetylase family protein [Candidatus Pacearchaeota archaeon]